MTIAKDAAKAAANDAAKDAAKGDATILHIGLGSFHRAHQAVYLDRLRGQGDMAWTIVAGNIRDDLPETMAALIAQQGQYTLETVSPAGERQYRRIRAIREVLAFDPSLARMIEVGADASTRIISCTVTEAGYYLDDRNRLDASHADLRADLETGSTRTLYGALAAILRQRLRQGGAPVTLLNCDNLRSNGTRLREGLWTFWPAVVRPICGPGQRPPPEAPATWLTASHRGRRPSWPRACWRPPAGPIRRR